MRCLVEMRRIRAAAAAGLVLALLALATAPARATFPGRNGKIAFDATSYTEGDESAGVGSIQAIGPSGRGALSVLVDPASIVVPDIQGKVGIGLPAFSADGMRLAFAASWLPKSSVFYDDHVFVANADGSGLRQVTSGSGLDDSDPSFSPDGTQIVFARQSADTAHRNHIFTVNLDGSGLRQLTFGAEANDQNPKFSPDGRKIFFDSRNGIDVMRADGSGRRALIRSDGNDFYVDVSPDGRRIAFVSSRLKAGRHHFEGIFVARSNGKGAHQLITGRTRFCFGGSQKNLYSPTFSPDGRRIVFAWDTIYGAGLIKIGLHGRPACNNLEIEGYDAVDPAWQPLP
jgi:dipeptidyl aminopeptidase/acylaminoacyl peptidase